MSLDFAQGIEIRENEPLSRHSSFKIGGNAKYAVFPKSRDELIEVLKGVQNCRYKYRTERPTG